MPPDWPLGVVLLGDIRFAADMRKSEAAAAFGLGGVHKPGMVLGFNKTPPRADQSDDEACVSLTHISISAVQIGYEPGARQNSDKWLHRLIMKLDGGIGRARYTYSSISRFTLASPIWRSCSVILCAFAQPRAIAASL